MAENNLAFLLLGPSVEDRGHMTHLALLGRQGTSRTKELVESTSSSCLVGTLVAIAPHQMSPPFFQCLFKHNITHQPHSCISHLRI
ncbi:hypothetical protein GDO78_017606 [Eleutherodactylus coqui]|uniref:Uncharacterized protein n=1 Tax=Eleutherodactylus coqui TaxID=57060 RepID=A0A8J6JRH1_ELECQ|nr:hypothetical protein GDO78_017606 [Eleutherodactylus coqui]